MTGRMTDDEVRKMLANIQAEAIPPTMLAELSESQRKMAVFFFALQQVSAEKHTAEVLSGVEKIVEKNTEKRDGKVKKMLQKMFSSVLGILKDPEL